MAGINSLALSLLSGNTTGKLTVDNLITLDTTSLLSGGGVGNAMSTYQLYQKNNAKLRENALKDPMIKTDIDYFKSIMNAGLQDTAPLDKETAYFFEKMPTIKTVDELFQDKRLTDYLAISMGVGYLKDDVATLKQLLTTKPVNVGGNVAVAGTLSEIVNSASGTTATVTKTVTGKVTNIKTDPVTGTMVGTIDDPLLGKITGTISGATTDPVTFVTTGSLTARINGTVTNKKEGTPGVFTGTVTGTASGIITRIQTGTVSGGVTSTLTVNLAGPVTGILTDVYTDPATSITTGKYTDPVTGLVVTGTVTGQSTNPITKKITGTINAATGTIPNEYITNVAGGAPLTGSVSKTFTGTLTGQTTDPITGQVTATINDPVFGSVTGIVTGSNSILGVVNGQITGEIKGTSRADFVGTITGGVSGEIYDSGTGVTTGTITDPVTGASVTGKVVNKRFDPLTGKLIADIVGTALDPARASVTGTLSGISVDGFGVITATSTSTEYRPVGASLDGDGTDLKAKEVAQSLVLYEGLTIVQNATQMAKFKTEYYQALAPEKEVRAEVDYFESKILNLKTVDDLFKDQRIVDYITTAYGLEAYRGNTAALKTALTTVPKTVDPNDPFNYKGVITDPKLRTAAEDLKLYTGTLGGIKTTTTVDKLENAYLAANDKSTIKTVDDIFNNRRLYNFVTKALGLEDQQNNFALVKKALLSDPSDTTSLSAKLSDTRFKDASSTIQLYGGLGVIKSPEMIAQLIAGYENVSYEGKIAEENEPVFLARYAEQRLGKITSAYELLSDKNLRTLVSGAYGIPMQIVNQGIETQAAYFTQRVKFDQLKDPDYVKKIISNYLSKSDLGQIV